MGGRHPPAGSGAGRRPSHCRCSESRAGQTEHSADCSAAGRFTNTTAAFVNNYVHQQATDKTSLCRSSSLGQQHDAARCCRYRSIDGRRRCCSSLLLMLIVKWSLYSAVSLGCQHNTLLAFAAERRCLLSIDIPCLRGAQQQTRRTPLEIQGEGRSTVS